MRFLNFFGNSVGEVEVWENLERSEWPKNFN